MSTTNETTTQVPFNVILNNAFKTSNRPLGQDAVEAKVREYYLSVFEVFPEIFTGVTIAIHTPFTQRMPVAEDNPISDCVHVSAVIRIRTEFLLPPNEPGKNWTSDVKDDEYAESLMIAALPDGSLRVFNAGLPWSDTTPRTEREISSRLSTTSNQMVSSLPLLSRSFYLKDKAHDQTIFKHQLNLVGFKDIQGKKSYAIIFDNRQTTYVVNTKLTPEYREGMFPHSNMYIQNFTALDTDLGEHPSEIDVIKALIDLGNSGEEQAKLKEDFYSRTIMTFTRIERQEF